MSTDGNLRKCPSCHYRLAGLPDVHQCPERGFEYDKRMVVIQQHAKIAWFMLCLCGINLGGAVNKLVSYETTPVAILAMLIASSCGVFAATRTVFFKKRITALVWEGGVAFLTADGISFGRYSWEQIHDAEYARFGGNARLVGHGGPTVDRIGQACFASDRQTKAFIEIVNRCRKKSRGEDAAPSVEVDGERVIQSGYRR